MVEKRSKSVTVRLKSNQTRLSQRFELLVAILELSLNLAVWAGLGWQINDGRSVDPARRHCAAALLVINRRLFSFNFSLASVNLIKI